MNPILFNVILGLGQKLIPFIVEKIVEVELDDTNPSGELKKEWTVANVEDYLRTTGKKLTKDELGSLDYIIDALVATMNEAGVLKPHAKKSEEKENCGCSCKRDSGSGW